MLIELWERLRGYDKWIETQASSVVAEHERFFVRKKGSRVPVFRTRWVLVWLDQQEIERTGVLELKGPLLPTSAATRDINLRFNPEAPAQFYVRKALEARISVALHAAMASAAFVAALLLAIILRKI